MKKDRKRTWKKLNRILCVCLACLFVPLNSSAAQIEDGELTIKHQAEEVDFTFYKVADFSEEGKFNLVGVFEEKKEIVENLETIETDPETLTTEIWSDLAYTLDAFVLHEKIAYDFIERTDENGLIVVNNLENGLYLIVGERAEIDGKMCTPKPMLITMPTRDVNEKWTNHLELDYATKLVPDEEYDEFSVVKIWDDEGNETKRPSEGIKVTLYQDDQVYEEIVLNDDNNWEYTWKELPLGSSWKVIESEVPEGYKMNVIRDGNVHVIENILDSEGSGSPGNPGKPGTSGGRIPQTGQLWWPVPILAILGIVFFAIGWTRRNSGGR